MEDVDDDGGFHDEQEVIVDNNSLDVDQGPEDDEDGTEDAIATTTLQQQHQPKQHTVIHSDLDNDGHVHEQGDGDKENMNSSNADSHQNLNRHDDDDEEEECRVCRGVAEEGRPLFTPCKCSGSMGKIHQDCLVSWLEVTRGDGRCEICKHKFRFEPQYAPNAPDRLPALEVILGLSNRFIAKWLPLAARICVALSLWLVVAPLLTNCLYHGWLIRPSSIFTRWKRELVMSDIVSGAVTTGVIIISFLSLMSFADFLRVHWQQAPGNRQDGAAGAAAPGADQQQPNERRRRRNANNNNDNEPDGNIFDEDDNHDDDGNLAGVDHGIIEFIKQRLSTNQQQDTSLTPDNENSSVMLDDSFTQTGIDIDSISEGLAKRAAIDQDFNTGEDEDDVHDHNYPPQISTHPNLVGHPDDGNNRVHNDSGNEDDRTDRHTENDTPPLEDNGGLGLDDDASGIADDGAEENNGDDHDDDDDDDDDHDENDDGDAIQNDDHLNNAQDNAAAFDRMDPILQDDQVDMEINVALDELLGLRGPLSVLVRNLLWLLAFNATYLGIFGFIPKTVGYVVYSGFFNTTAIITAMKSVPYIHSDHENRTTVVSILTKIEEESASRQTTFKLSDFATVTLGYLSIAFCIVLMKYGLMLFTKAGRRFGMEQTYARIAAANIRENDGAGPGARREAMRRDRLEAVNDDGVDEDVLGISAALDATVAIVKVGVLLFLKMFLLPLSLGIVLDASTFELFGHESSDRLSFAGGDLFSFILLHWVGGITFMLLVTVFLLQLREVFHPEILARIIRPQEPQPDLLGNLMHETVLTHMKRMALSLAIYAPLMGLHVALPAKVFVASGLGDHFTFFHLHFCYILMPQLQIPIELIVFHLSMLALLERYKNSIGGLQHSWMKFMCRRMGLTDYLLPRCVESFELVGSKAVFLTPENDESQLQVDPFFLELIGKQDDVDHFVLSNIDREQDHMDHGEVRGETKVTGDRVLSIDIDSISIPVPKIVTKSPEISSTTSVDQVFSMSSSLLLSPRESTNNTNRATENFLNESMKLLPTRIGRYRLRLEESGPSTRAEDLRIEFFQEVPGSEIPRPPEGWDDLGQGGAFVQGRWAWGKERMSAVERSVSHRTPFRTANHRRPIKLMVKVVSLMLLSWVALTFTVLSLLSLPLCIGRSFYHLFHIPDMYLHDPFAFCIGAGLFFPLCSMLSKFFHNQNQVTMATKIRTWISSFKLPPRNKGLVLLESLVLWLMASPLVLGISYQLVVVKESTWFSGQEPLIDWKFLAVSWLMGIVMLNTWSFLLYFEFFTRRFWKNVGNGILEPPVEDNALLNVQGNNDGRNVGAAAAADNNQAEHREMESWHGKHGRVARYFHMWQAVLDGWQWDIVDKTVLLDDFTRPVAKQLASALLGSFLSFQVLHILLISVFSTQEDGINMPLLGVIGTGTVNQFVLRFCMTVHIAVQIIANSQESILCAFEIAHEAARDDRYLVGELLMNFNRDEYAS